MRYKAVLVRPRGGVYALTAGAGATRKNSLVRCRCQSPNMQCFRVNRLYGKASPPREDAPRRSDVDLANTKKSATKSGSTLQALQIQRENLVRMTRHLVGGLSCRRVLTVAQWSLSSTESEFQNSAFSFFACAMSSFILSAQSTISRSLDVQLEFCATGAQVYVGAHMGHEMDMGHEMGLGWRITVR